MLINLTDIFTSEGKERTESIPYEPNNFSYMGGLYIIQGTGAYSFYQCGKRESAYERRYAFRFGSAR